MTYQWIFAILLPLLLIALLIFEKRRQKERLRAINTSHESEQTNEDAEEAIMSEGSLGESFIAFIRGRPTRHLTAFSVYQLLHGIVAIGLIGFVVYMVLQSAIKDPTVRIILESTVAAMLLVLIIAGKRHQSKQDKNRPQL